MKQKTVIMTEGEPSRILFWFALPILLGNIFQQLYSIVDSIIVGQFINTNAFSAVGICATVIGVTVFFIVGFCVGTSISVAQFRGANHEKAIRDAIVTGGMMLFLWSMLVTLVGALFSRPILQLIHTPEELLDTATLYCTISLCGSIAPTIYHFCANTLRALGDSRMPLVALVFSSGLNIVLDLVCILCFHWGVAGAAIATIFSQLVSSGLCVVYFARKFPNLIPRRENFRIHIPLIQKIIAIGFPMSLQMMFESLGVVIVQSVVNGFGSSVVAAYTAASKIDMIAMQPMMAMGSAMSTYTGQNYGANQHARIRSGIRASILLSAVVCVALTVFIRVFGGQLTSLFISDGNTEEIITIAKEYLSIVSTFYFVGNLMYIYTNTLRGMDSALIPLICSVMGMVGKVAAVNRFGHWWGYQGLWYAWPLAWFVALLPALVWFYWTANRCSLKTNNLE